MRPIARIRSLKKLTMIKAKCLPSDFEALAGHPSLEYVDMMLTIFDEISDTASRDRLVIQLTTMSGNGSKQRTRSRWLGLK